ncbi:MAG: MaoC family dehydratase [Lachnospirales bacterium]
MRRLYEDFEVGEKQEFAKTVTEADVYNFAGVTGDFNPAHLNEEYAKGTMFKTRIAHGMLSAGFISACLGTKLPGEGAIYMSQEMKFTAPVLIGDTVTATCEIIEKLGKGKLRVKTTCTKQDGTVVIDGEAILMIPRA